MASRETPRAVLSKQRVYHAGVSGSRNHSAGVAPCCNLSLHFECRLISSDENRANVSKTGLIILWGEFELVFQKPAFLKGHAFPGRKAKRQDLQTNLALSAIICGQIDLDFAFQFWEPVPAGRGFQRLWQFWQSFAFSSVSSVSSVVKVLPLVLPLILPVANC